MSELPSSVRIEQIHLQWTNLYKTLYLGIILKPVKKIQSFINPKKNNGYFT
jgi:hypothetical protein